jgi:superfamily I DNA/RNA helicase
MQPMQVDRLIGGAGTGKTAFVLDQMNRVREQKNLSHGEIAFATFTKSGCAEMARRAADSWGLTPDGLPNFRTVHSLAYRSQGLSRDEFLGNDSDSLAWKSEQIGVELAAAVDEAGNPVQHALSADDSDEVAALELWDLARVTLRPLSKLIDERVRAGERVPSEDTIAQVVQQYETAKAVSGRRDFCDVVLAFAGYRMTLDGGRVCDPEGEIPEGLRAIFVDECQDNSALIDLAILRLACTPGVEYVLLAGDPMQSIYESFAGGSSTHFMQWNANQRVMPKSYRCAAPILELGERCLQEMGRDYWDRKIAPAEHAGSIIQAAGPVDAIEENLDLSKQTLIVARCGYALQSYAEVLDDLGVPYCYATRDVDADLKAFSVLWNLQAGGWVEESDWQIAIDMFPVKHKQLGDLLVAGEKAAWLAGRRGSSDLVGPAYLERTGCTPLLAGMIRRGDWPEAIEASKQEKAAKWIDRVRRHGHDLATRPSVRLATIHAAKGLEADTVLLSTHSSRRVERGRESSTLRHNEECRVNYVAATRARSKLVIVEDGTRHRLILPF